MLTFIIFIRISALNLTRLISPESAYAQHLERLLRNDIKEMDRELTHRQRARETNAREKQLSETSKQRFSRELLWALLYSGWTEGRRIDADWINLRQAEGLPAELAEKLREFGELDLVRGRYSLTTSFSEENRFVTDRSEQLTKLMGRSLYLAGWTNVYCVDGLGLYLDNDGNVYGDGESGWNKPEEKYFLEHFATSIEGFLEMTMGAARKDSLKVLGRWPYGEGQPTTSN